MRSMFSRVPPDRPDTRLRRSAETALTGDATLLLIIATTIVLVCGWFAWRSYESEDDLARGYARRTVQRLAVAHDLHYLTTNLSSAAMPGYPAGRRQLIISSLTKLGIPSGPIELVAAGSQDRDPNVPGSITRFTTHLTYPKADARLYLKVARWHGTWRIELLALEWKDTSAPGPAASP